MSWREPTIKGRRRYHRDGQFVCGHSERRLPYHVLRDTSAANASFHDSSDMSTGASVADSATMPSMKARNRPRKLGRAMPPGGAPAGASGREAGTRDDGLERVVVQQVFFALIERVFEVEEHRAAQVDELAQLCLRQPLRAPRAVKPGARDAGVRQRQLQLDDARDAAMPDRDLLVSLRLPDLKRQVDERDQDGDAAGEAPHGGKIGK